MTYSMTARVAESQRLWERITAAAATEGIPEPYTWTLDNRWVWAASPGWSDAWAAAQTNDPGNDVGGRLDVITDGMILATVQALKPAEV